MELGILARDSITGFSGVTTAVCRYLDGTTSVQVTPPVDAEGRLRDPAWFDHARLVGATDTKEAPAPFAPAVPAVPSAAVAAPLPTVPEAPPAFSPEPTSAAPLPSTPVTATPPAPPPSGVELDKNGLPWDGRIHGSTRAKNQDGSWRQKRNTAPEYVAQIEQELRAAMGAPAAVPAAPTAAVAAAPAPLETGAPSVPAAPAGGMTSASPSSFPAFLQVVTAAVTAGKFSQADVVAACQAVGVPSLPALGARLDLIPSVCLQLGV